jgi:hypothetical protein
LDLLFSIIGFIGCWMLWYAMPGAASLMIPMLGIILALVGMEYAAVFNNAMMPTLVPRSELGRLSGSAWGLGYIGGLISLVIVLGFLSANPDTGKTLLGLTPLFGLDPATHEGDRASGPLTSLWYLVFVLPMFLWTPDVARRAADVGGAIKRGLSELGQTLRSLPSQKSYFSFLISSMFYRDALNALYSFGGIYAAGVLGWPIIKIGIFGILANLTGAIGAWLGGRADQRFGPKPVIAVSIVLLIICCVMIISTTPTQVLFVKVAEPGTTVEPARHRVLSGRRADWRGRRLDPGRVAHAAGRSGRGRQGDGSLWPLCAVRPRHLVHRAVCDRLRHRLVCIRSLWPVDAGRAAPRRHADHRCSSSSAGAAALGEEPRLQAGGGMRAGGCWDSDQDKPTTAVLI